MPQNTVIIAADGPEKFKGRHVVPIDGERLLDRTARQFSAFGPVIITGKHGVGTPEFESSGDSQADALLSTEPLWPIDGKVILVLGDTYFTDEAAATVMGRAGYSPKFYGRWGPSEITGAPYGELFALSFGVWEGYWLADLQRFLVRQKRRRLIWRSGLWELYRASVGIEPVDRHTAPGRNFTEINDWTDDFDTPKELEEWRRRRAIAASAG